MVAVAALVGWLVAQGASPQDFGVGLPFVGVTVGIVGWWFVQASDRRRYGYLLAPPTIEGAAQEAGRRSADLAARGREFGVLAGHLATAASTIDARRTDLADRGDVDALASATRALRRGRDVAEDVDRRINTQCAGVAHFVEHCEGDPGAAAGEYGRVSVVLDRPVLRVLLDWLLAEIGQAQKDLVGVAFAHDDAPWVAQVTRDLQAGSSRLRGVIEEVRADGYRLSRAVDRLHHLAARTLLDDALAGAARRTARIAVVAVVRGRPAEHRPASRTAFVDVVTNHLDVAWRSLGRGGMAALAHDDRVGTP